MPNKPGKVVFVGNIPYNLTEPQLIDVFKEVGRVVSFRLLFDRETGKPKGYGFCTFEDAETASSAVRNLNNVCIGGRQLRVDFSENEKEEVSSTRPGTNIEPDPVIEQPHEYPIPGNSYQRIAPIQQHFQKPSSERLTDSINNTIAHYPTDQLIQALYQLKLLVQKSPDVARALLMTTPQLTYAVFQALLVTKIIDKRVIQWALQPPQFRGDINQQPHNMTIPSHIRPSEQHGTLMEHQTHDNISDANSQNQHFSSGINTRMGSGIQQQKFMSNFPRGHHPLRRPSDNPIQDQQELLPLQLLNLTPEQIMSLQDGQNNNINRLRAQLLNAKRDPGNIQ